MLIKGQSIILYSRTITGQDDFGTDIYTEQPITINNVLIGETSSDDVLSEVTLSGKKIAYTLAIPREDNNDWINKTVEFYGRKWSTVGVPMQYIDENMPSWFPWNKKVKVVDYE